MPALQPVFLEYLKDRYFRSGPKTHLSVVILNGEDDVTLAWSFTFQDLGSTHRISGDSVLSMPPYCDDCTLVDGVPCYTVDQVERLVFGWHYEDYVRELYAEEGIVL
jgi:hypothetical protein